MRGGSTGVWEEGESMMDGIRVLDLSDERGQLCGMMLADLGAEVVCIEPPEGSNARRHGPFADSIRDPENLAMTKALKTEA